MARVNTHNNSPIKTHEGAKATILSSEKELTRAVMTCMLFEDTFYESAQDFADRIKELCKKVSPQFLSELAIKARNDMHLRSVSLFLVRELARQNKGKIVSETINAVIQRADELSEFLAMYWLDGKQPLSAQVKKGLAKAFEKFSEYQLAKYNRDNVSIKLRDVLFLCHAKPKDKIQDDLWKRLIENKLTIPDTWETQLSAGKNKKETFERLIKENKLGYMALLRNLRNMEQAGCDIDLVCSALLSSENIAKSKVLPFRFVAAEQNVSTNKIKQTLNQAFMVAIQNIPKLDGITIVLVDVSGSMDSALSDKSDMRRLEAAAALSAILKESSQTIVYSFSNLLAKITSSKKGMAFIDEVINSQEHGGTYLGEAIKKVNGDPCERVIIITDEQTHDSFIPCWANHGYIINICGYKPSIDYQQDWELISGWSDKVVNYIHEIEKL